MIFAATAGIALTPGHTIVRDRDDLVTMVNAMRSAPERAFDFETDGFAWYKGKRPIGYALGMRPAAGGWPVCWYVPFRHHDPSAVQIAPAAAKQAFEDALVGAQALIGHNLKFDLNMGRAAGWQIPEDAAIHDTLIQAYNTYEKRELTLEAVAANEGVSRWADPFAAKNVISEYLRERAKAHRLPLEKDDKHTGKLSYRSKFGHIEVPVAIEGEYSCRDVSHALCLDAKLRAQAMGIGTELQAQRAFLYDNEMTLVRALAELEWEGQEVDKDYMIALGDDLTEDCARRERELDRLFGTPLKWSSDDHVRHLLYDRLKLPVQRMTAGGRMGAHKRPAVDRAAIEDLVGLDPRLKELAEYKARLTVLRTFTYSLAFQVGDDGKIHTSILQTGTGSGRFSSKDPNFQNIPKRHKELAKRVRKGWVIRPGRVRLYNDYSQIELRMLAWVCNARTFIRAYASPSYDALCRGEITYDEYRWYRRSEPPVDIHSSVACAVFGITPSHPDHEYKRRAAKPVNFGVPYGGGANLLVSNPDIRMAPDEAERFLADYHAANPEISDTKGSLFRKMRSRRGTPYFANWAGRKVHGPRLKFADEEVRAEEERSMFASLIQGSAGELTRVSLVRWYRLWKAGVLPAKATNTIHDEIQYDLDEADLPYVASETQRLGEDFAGLFGSTPVILDQQASTTTWADAAHYDFWKAGQN